MRIKIIFVSHDFHYLEPTSEEEEEGQSGNTQDEQYDTKEGEDYDNSKESKNGTTDASETSSEQPRGLGMCNCIDFVYIYCKLIKISLQVYWAIERDFKCDGQEH